MKQRATSVIKCKFGEFIEGEGSVVTYPFKHLINLITTYDTRAWQAIIIGDNPKLSWVL